jgi:hypothetical protein
MGRQFARDALYRDRAIIHDCQSHSGEYGVCVGAGRQTCQGDERKPTPAARGAIDDELDVGELHTDPGKGRVQIWLGGADVEAADIHANRGRGTLEGHGKHHNHERCRALRVSSAASLAYGPPSIELQSAMFFEPCARS